MKLSKFSLFLPHLSLIKKIFKLKFLRLGEDLNNLNLEDIEKWDYIEKNIKTILFYQQCLDICLKYSGTNKICDESIIEGFNNINYGEEIKIDELEKVAISNWLNNNEFWIHSTWYIDRAQALYNLWL